MFSKKKIISFFLAVAMVFSVMSIPAFAEDTYTWEIDEDGVLTISGTGELPFVWGGSKTPWETEKERITAVVVNEGITSLGDCAFDDLTYITSATLPKSLEKIGTATFQKCKFLKTVNLPENLEILDQWAFDGCASLTEVTIPASVTTMGTYVFRGCSSLKKAVFQNSLSTLPEHTFSGCTSLEEITFPGEVAKIGGYAFYGCSGLKKVVLPETATILGSCAFNGCTSLSEINTENILDYYVNGNRHFANCSSLDTIAINETVKIIPPCMFENSGITHLVLPENLQKIEGNAFYGCAKLETVNIPKKLTYMGSAIFNGCVSLKEFSMPKNITQVQELFFEGCTSLSDVTLHDDVTRIGRRAFADCTSLKNLTLPKSLNYLGAEAFTGTGITEITIPKSLLTAGHGEGLSTGLFPYDYNKGPFGGSPLETVYFESGTTEIVDGLFQGAKKLKNVDLSNIERIGSYSFSNCTEFVPVLTETTKEIGNYAFTRCIGITDFVFPAWMETIPNGLLAGTGIGYVVFPETVKVIGADAYNGCKNLSYIEFSDTVTDIGNYAFYGCTALDEIDIPGTVINIGQQAFMACSNLKKLTMHKGTQTTGSQAFADCNLTEVRPSQTIRVLNDGMFTGNPVKLLVVPRFCVTWDGWGNYYNTFNPSISYVPANVENFDIYTYEDATIKGVAGTAGEAEALREENVSFEALTAGIEALGFDIDAVDIVLDETYDSAAVVTVNVEDVIDLDTKKAVPTDGELITFKSDNEEVATVDKSGFIHGVGYGTANITISCDSGKSDVLTVNVVRPSIGVSISSGYIQLRKGYQQRLSANTIPAGYEETFIWSSSDESVATVDQNGYVSGVENGTALITVEGVKTGKTASCVVAVSDINEMPDRIAIDSFMVGCDVSLTDAQDGGNVIGALYDKEGKLIGSSVVPADDKVNFNFTVSPTADLSGANIKIFWWNMASIKPISSFRVIELD